MYDAGKVVSGLVLFIVFITFPAWFNVAVGTADYVPELAKPVKGERCVAETEYMRSSHMDLLNTWRDDVVRRGDRVYTAGDGTRYNKSLSRTCLDCHADKVGFCDKCHDYLKVAVYCWDCHVIPQETQR